MARKLHRVLALWFVLQIVLPFTAPLQTVELRDLLGKSQSHHRKTDSPESSTTPVTSETEADANTFVSPIDASALRASTTLAVMDYQVMPGPVMSAFSLSPSPQIQQTVLRL